jgi:hypothetical protein
MVISVYQKVEISYATKNDAFYARGWRYLWSLVFSGT